MMQIPYNFTPRGYQAPIYNARSNGVDRGFTIWHRRAGKDKTFINIMSAEMFRRVGTYFYILPYYKQARLIIWEGADSKGFKFIDHIPAELVKRKENQQMVLEAVNGSVLRLLGSDNIDAIVGTNPVGVLFSEFSLHKPQAWHYLRPILLENKGWALFNGTPRGRNHAYKLWLTAQKDPAWFSQLCTVADTYDETGRRIITEEDLEKERQSGMPEELIQQEYFCDFDAGMVGAYYAGYIKTLIDLGRIKTIMHEPDLPVYCGWDLGLNDTNVIWFAQLLGQEVRLIDLLADRTKGLPFYVNEINKKGYTIARHFLPFDINVTELGSGRTRQDTLSRLGIRNVTVVPKLGVEEGRNAVRQLLPRCWFDEARCFEGIEALKTYRREYDDKNDTFRDTHVHDWSIHYADAFRTLALGLPSITGVDITNQEYAIGTGYDPFNPAPSHFNQELFSERYTDPNNYDPFSREVYR